jgi:hypothetical protein
MKNPGEKPGFFILDFTFKPLRLQLMGPDRYFQAITLGCATAIQKTVRNRDRRNKASRHARLSGLLDEHLW